MFADPTELEKVGNEGEELPLPTLDDNQADKALLIEQQQQDETLTAGQRKVKRGMGIRMDC